MNRLTIEIKGEVAAVLPLFKPGATVRGEVSWVLAKEPKAVWLRLFWYTKGKGTEDVAVVEEIPFNSPRKQERRPFAIPLPESPYSFSGKLVSLIWSLELATQRPDEAIRKEIILSPLDHEIDLLLNQHEA